MAHPLAIRLRNLTRRVGLNRVVGRVLVRSGYETRLAAELRNAVRVGDCAWDVGANVGWYTTRLSSWVGPEGCVFAFEPVPPNLARLHEAVADAANIVVIPTGLSDREADAAFLLGSDPTGASSRIVPDHLADPQAGRIALTTGDALVERGAATLPDLLKIDVEGHEFEVLRGMAETLARGRLRSVFVEVHFDLLRQQGRADVPAAIENFLRSYGFKSRWIGSSHLHASR